MSAPLRWSIILALLLGMIANWAIAWRCLYKQYPPGNPRPWRSAQSYWDQYAEPDPAHLPATYHHKSGALGCDFLIIRAGLKGAAAEDAMPHMMITRAGFPLRALEAMHSWGPVRPAVSGGFLIKPHNPNVAWLSVLPYRPLVLGFIGNTLFYGGLFWLLTCGPIVAWRRLRRLDAELRELCPQCRYDLRGDLARGCPECGWHRT